MFYSADEESALMAGMAALERVYEKVIFDMDGTLVPDCPAVPDFNCVSFKLRSATQSRRWQGPGAIAAAVE